MSSSRELKVEFPEDLGDELLNKLERFGNELPEILIGIRDKIELVELEPARHLTKPPPSFRVFHGHTFAYINAVCVIEFFCTFSDDETSLHVVDVTVRPA